MWFLSSFINNYMAFRRVQGKTKLMWFPVTVSTAIAKGALVYIDTSVGTLKAATATTAGPVIVGVLKQAITAADSDYATARLVPVEVPVEKWVIWECDAVTTGTPSATADIAIFHDIDDSVSLDVDNSTYDIFYATKVVSSSRVQGVLNIGPEILGVQ